MTWRIPMKPILRKRIVERWMWILKAPWISELKLSLYIFFLPCISNVIYVYCLCLKDTITCIWMLWFFNTWRHVYNPEKEPGIRRNMECLMKNICIFGWKKLCLWALEERQIILGKSNKCLDVWMKGSGEKDPGFRRKTAPSWRTVSCCNTYSPESLLPETWFAKNFLSIFPAAGNFHFWIFEDWESSECGSVQCMRMGGGETLLHFQLPSLQCTFPFSLLLSFNPYNWISLPT